MRSNVFARARSYHTFDDSTPTPSPSVSRCSSSGLFSGANIKRLRVPSPTHLSTHTRTQYALAQVGEPHQDGSGGDGRGLRWRRGEGRDHQGAQTPPLDVDGPRRAVTRQAALVVGHAQHQAVCRRVRCAAARRRRAAAAAPSASSACPARTPSSLLPLPKAIVAKQPSASKMPTVTAKPMATGTAAAAAAPAASAAASTPARPPSDGSAPPTAPVQGRPPRRLLCRRRRRLPRARRVAPPTHATF